MKREWFFIKDESPIGPYNLEELNSFILQKEIKADTLIQNITDSNWKPAYKFPEFSSLFPDAALSLKNKNLSMPSIDSLILSSDELKDEKIEFTLREYKLPSKFKNETKNEKHIYIISFLIFALFFFLYLFFLKPEKVIEFDIDDIHQSNHKKITEIINSLDENLELDLFLSKDKKNIYIVSNSSSKLKFELTLTPIVNTLPSSNSKSLHLLGLIENKFGKIKLNDNFIIGRYSYNFIIKKIPLWVFYTHLESFEYLRKFDQLINFKSSKLLIDQTEEKYQETLKKYFKDELNKLQKPFLDRIARLETLLITLNQIWMALEDNLKYLKTGSDALIFESIYNREAEVILQRLIVDVPIGDQASNELIVQIKLFIQNKIEEIKSLKKIKAKEKELQTIECLNKIKNFETQIKIRIEEIKKMIPEKLN